MANTPKDPTADNVNGVFPAESAAGADHQITMLLQPALRNGRRYLNPVLTKLGGLSIMFRVGPQFLLGAKARSPHGPLGPFHTDPTIYTTDPRSGLRIPWIGHATLLIEMDGVRILIDPVWDERAAPTMEPIPGSGRASTRLACLKLALQIRLPSSSLVNAFHFNHSYSSLRSDSRVGYCLPMRLRNRISTVADVRRPFAMVSSSRRVASFIRIKDVITHHSQSRRGTRLQKHSAQFPPARALGA
jgi:hypothetical protein